MITDLKIFFASPSALKAADFLDKDVQDSYVSKAIQSVQLQKVVPLIGDNLFESLAQKIKDGSIVDEENVRYKELLDGYLFHFIGNHVCAKLQFITTFKIKNKGVINTSDDNISVVSMDDVRYLSQMYMNDADTIGMRIKDYLCKNIKEFPELKDDCSCDEQIVKFRDNKPNPSPMYFKYRCGCNCKRR